VILSIGLIVKNEEKYLKSCLSGIKPILDSLDAELVITDTGSIDNTVNIAKEFTDKINFFEWCNDFSKARNFNMNSCSGKWYMYIDADEILVNSQDIIDFFQKKMYLKYNGLSVIIRSFYDKSCTNYSDYRPLRLFERKPDVQFKYAVHEMLTKFDTDNMYISNAVFNHYGYINDANGRFNKKKKNYMLVMERLVKDEPQSIRNYLQLAMAYLSISNYKMAYLVCKNSLLLCEELGIYGCIGFYRAFYHYMLLSEYRMNDLQNVLKTADRYFSVFKTESFSNLNIYDILMNTFYDIREYDRVGDFYEKYISLFKKIKNGFHADDELCIEKLLNTEIDYLLISLKAVRAYIKCDKIKSAEKIFNKILSKDYKSNNIFEEILSVGILIIYYDASYFDKLINYVLKNNKSIILEKFIAKQKINELNLDVYNNFYRLILNTGRIHNVLANVRYNLYKNIFDENLLRKLNEIIHKNLYIPDMIYIVYKGKICFSEYMINNYITKENINYIMNTYKDGALVLKTHLDSLKDFSFPDIKLLDILNNRKDINIDKIYSSAISEYKKSHFQDKSENINIF